MDGTHHVVVGDRGRLVLPAEVRDRLNLTQGTRLILVEADDGLVLLTRDQLKARVRRDLAGLNLVDELLAERRAAAAADDVA